MRYLFVALLLFLVGCHYTPPCRCLDAPGEPGTKEWCLKLDYPNNFCMNQGWVPE